MAAGLAVRKGLEAPVTGEAQGSAGCDEGLESSGYVVLVHEGRAPGDPPPKSNQGPVPGMWHTGRFSGFPPPSPGLVPSALLSLLPLDASL